MSSDAKIVDWQTATQVVSQWKQQKLSIVFTNGCFDIIHIGHVDYLEKARALGDKLILGLNSDSSVRNIKGEKRPVVSEYARARVMAALSFVDAVVLFDEDTPLRLIQTIKPDILVKGDDYMLENIVGADFVIENGGSVKTVPLVKGFSTSAIIQKIKNVY
ncbi:D-glycero-beta-D-manno-heptose 1-phosphate adenylyltransferase [Rhodocytophaga rosea]|uniref:D-glycero-beta-D-manno-heptose 1-phosphate adenylyltransferase n=1 Tax=Rhodocytophaga rosea TaxID=2704465 RepID=A0A6C0GK09_9BACT|nr:D-glycero-beta-D-manno-heptose 1-phosphate adenylyltransferase [Rhodocytophaga rosea]QHT68154.1 D-glycero-beta-D-manno-heptose 1-phosphate adenylyltransferase [Rhodocytophaga rosea]